jgi:Protein of unknown function (DUF2878)
VSRLVLNAVCFQAGWLACVAGGNRGALLACLLILPLHARFVSRCPREWRVALALAGLGLGMDLAWQAAGLLRFEGALLHGVPPWLALLWLLFALSLFHSLAWLRRSAWLAAAAGAIAGPFTYIAGLRLGAAGSPFPEWQLALVMAPAWALLLPVMTHYTRDARPGHAEQATSL